MLPEKLVFVDIETTGLSATHDRIIEIGMLRVEDNMLVSTYHTLLNPLCHISPSIFAMTGIRPQELEHAPTFGEVHEQVEQMLSDAVFVAHNVRFDYGFLRNEFGMMGIKYSSKHFCTVKLSKYLFPTLGRYNLDTIIKHFNIDCENRHRAFDDAKVLWEFYQKLRRDIPSDTLIQAVSKALKRPSIPNNLSQKDLDTLPESPGVYIFYGEKGVPLYVGKSINIKERVLSHFSSDHSSSKEMKISQQIESIETIMTSGELGALLTESRLVKQLQPLYNRKLRLTQKLYVLKTGQTTEGYTKVFLERVSYLTPEDISQIVGVFRSKRQAKEFLILVAKEYQLCEKLLELEKTKTSCFAYRLGHCKGACIGVENPLVYNARCIIAFSKNKIKPWPFSGPVVIRETNLLEDMNEAFLVDQWCLLGSVKTNGENTNEELDKEYIFDVDTYKILSSHILSNKGGKSLSIKKFQGNYLVFSL